MSVEHHGKRFSTSLSMPKYAALTIGGSCNLSFFNRFSNRKILMISGKNFNRILTISGKENKVLDNIKQTLSLEHSFIEGVKLRISSIFIIAVLGFPFHKTVKTGSDSSCLVCGKIADYANSVVYEHRRNVLHIIADLIICVLCSYFILGRALQFH